MTVAYYTLFIVGRIEQYIEIDPVSTAVVFITQFPHLVTSIIGFPVVCFYSIWKKFIIFLFYLYIYFSL